MVRIRRDPYDSGAEANNFRPAKFNGHRMGIISQHETIGNFRDHAINLAERFDWSIIPVEGKSAEGLVKWKPFQTRRPDADTLRKLFSKKRITGLAVICGTVSGGLAVRDLDDSDDYLNWALANQADAKRLPTVKTLRGYHIYGRLDEEAFADFGNGELRADSKHIVILPPSIHPSGAVYRWTVPLPESEPLPELPASLTLHLRAYPKMPAALNVVQAQAKWTKAR
jgi:hypothetical protein